MPKVLVPLAQGCEELEAVTIIDILRRANVEVVTAGLDGKPVKASRGVTLVPDTTLDEALRAKDYDMVALPGGMPGADHLGADKRLTALLVEMAGAGKFVAAICAAPKVLAQAGLLDGKRATSYPTMLEPFAKVKNTGAPVERDGNILTGRGPGTAMDFALALVEALCGKSVRDKTEQPLVRP